jgi:hypothetical protein
MAGLIYPLHPEYIREILSNHLNDGVLSEIVKYIPIPKRDSHIPDEVFHHIWGNNVPGHQVFSSIPFRVEIFSVATAGLKVTGKVRKVCDNEMQEYYSYVYGDNRNTRDMYFASFEFWSEVDRYDDDSDEEDSGAEDSLTDESEVDVERACGYCDAAVSYSELQVLSNPDPVVYMYAIPTDGSPLRLCPDCISRVGDTCSGCCDRWSTGPMNYSYTMNGALYVYNVCYKCVQTSEGYAALRDTPHGLVFDATQHRLMMSLLASN